MIEKEKLRKVKNYFLELLKTDEDVQEEIRKIVHGLNDVENNNGYDEKSDGILQKKYDELVVLYNSLEQRNKKVNDENELMKKQLIEKQEQITEQEQIYVKKINDIQKKYEESEKQRGQLLKNYDNLDRIYNLYLNLEPAVQRSLERILSPSERISDTAELFLSYGVQEGNVVALWDAIATDVMLYEREYCLDDLCIIFRYFLELHKSVSFKKTEIFDVEPGELYDERYHTRTSNSSATGKIRRVILPGFSIGKNITKKALVILEER